MHPCNLAQGQPNTPLNLNSFGSEVFLCFRHTKLSVLKMLEFMWGCTLLYKTQ